MSRLSDIHNNGDCWPPLCAICDLEEEAEDDE